MFFKRQPVHFVGIGGIGMSGLAEVLLELGYPVSGSDLKLSPATERLAARGAVIHEGHAAANVVGANAVVMSSAVRPDNPEVVEARRLGLPVIPRGELLAELMRLKFGIAIAGSHGKTTTTSLVAALLIHAGLDPSVMVGGRAAVLRGSNARVGAGDYLVVESDESDGSFLKLAPILAVVTNIDREHLDHYADLDAICRAFVEFVNRVPFYGASILCLDDENVQRILPRINRRLITYRGSAQADLQIIRSSHRHKASAFHQADTVHLVDIYPASEQPIEGVTSQALAQRMQTFGHRGAMYAGSMDAGIESVLKAADAGDAIVTLGAGSVSQAGNVIVE